MAVQTYRYRKVDALDIAKIQAEVGLSTTFVGADGGHVIDYSIEDSTENLADLDASLLLRGYARIVDNPTSNPEDSFTPTSGGGGGGSASSGYKFSSNVGGGDPGSKKFAFDNTSYASITKIYISDTPNSPAIDFGLYLTRLNPGDRILCKQNNSADRAVLLEVVSKVDNTGWWTITVVHLDDGGGSMLQNNQSCTVGLIYESSHIKHNLSATTNPVGADDNTQGYSPGSVWLRDGTSGAWIAGSVATGSANWIDIAGGGAAALSHFLAIRSASLVLSTGTSHYASYDVIVDPANAVHLTYNSGLGELTAVVALKLKVRAEIGVASNSNITGIVVIDIVHNTGGSFNDVDGGTQEKMCMNPYSSPVVALCETTITMAIGDKVKIYYRKKSSTGTQTATGGSNKMAASVMELL